MTRALETGPAASAQRWRLAADALEAAIISSLESWLISPGAQADLVISGRTASEVGAVQRFLDYLRKTASALESPAKLKMWAEHIGGVNIVGNKMTITLNLRPMMPENLREFVSESVTLETEIQLTKRGQGMRLILGATDASALRDEVALRLVARAHRWRDAWFSNAASELAEIAEGDGAPVSDASKQIRLAFLAPEIIEALLDGRTNVATAERLRRLPELPAGWADQRRLLLSRATQN